MAIDIEKLKGILKPLIEGREDAADIIEEVMKADDGEDNAPDMEAIKAEALKEARAEMNDRYMSAFFGEGRETETVDNATATKTASEKEAEGAVAEDEHITMNSLIEGIEKTYNKEEA